MFVLGVVRRITDEGVYILVNDKPYHTSKMLIPSKKIKSIPNLQIGSKICYDDGVIKLTEYIDCKKCHQPLKIDGDHVCNCKPKDMIDTAGELIKTEYKRYLSNTGFKVSLKTDEKVLHCVLFEKDALLDIMEEFKIGDKVYFKAIVKDRGDVHDLVKIFHVQNFK